MGLTHQIVAYNRKLIDAKANDPTITWLNAFIEVRVKNLAIAKDRMGGRFTYLESLDELAEGVWEWDEYVKAKKELIDDWHARPHLLKKGISLEQEKRNEQRELKRKKPKKGAKKSVG